MDIPRKSGARRRRIRWAVYITVTAVCVGLVTVWAARLEPAAPSKEWGTLYTDTVKRGSMLRQVRGLGTLVPEEIRWITSVTDGTVERRLVEAGTPVKADTVVMELSNPELEQNAADSEAQLKAVQAEYEDLKIRLESSQLTQEADAARVQADYNQAKMQAEVNEELAKQGLISDLTWKLSDVRAKELTIRHDLEQKRLAKFADSIKAQLAAQKARVDQARAQHEIRRSQVEGLNVRSGIDGVIQVLAVEVGQRVGPGANLARVSQPSKLKAELRIAETQVKDIMLGQPAMVDTRNGIIPGHVARIDLASQNATVTVDVKLEGELPKSARPDLNVEGTIELERLEDILYVNRPVHGQENSTISLFKVDAGRQGAVRVQVKLGRTSVNTIEVISGLQVGDEVILSDMSDVDGTDRIRLN